MRLFCNACRADTEFTYNKSNFLECSTCGNSHEFNDSSPPKQGFLAQHSISGQTHLTHGPSPSLMSTPTGLSKSLHNFYSPHGTNYPLEISSSPGGRQYLPGPVSQGPHGYEQSYHSQQIDMTPDRAKSINIVKNSLNSGVELKAQEKQLQNEFEGVPYANEEGRKCLTIDNIDKLNRKNIKKYSTQVKAMNATSAGTVAQQLGLSDRSGSQSQARQYHWMHLIAFSMGGSNYNNKPNVPENLILGTGPANGQHLTYETIAKHFVRKNSLNLIVEYKLKNPLSQSFHAYSDLHYKAWVPFNIEGAKENIELFNIIINPLSSWSMTHSKSMKETYQKIINDFKEKFKSFLSEVEAAKAHTQHTLENTRYIFAHNEDEEVNSIEPSHKIDESLEDLEHLFKQEIEGEEIL